MKSQVAIVTGASSGIGRAIAIALAKKNMAVVLVGRDQRALAEVKGEVSKWGATARTCVLDLSQDDQVQALSAKIKKDFGRVDLLVHAAGIIKLGELESVSVADFDQQYKINVRLPFLLTQALVPQLKKSRGLVVFINSTVGTMVKAGVGHYGATKHALRAIAETFRLELNPYGVRVLSLYPGNTATPMQKMIREKTNRTYKPHKLVQPEDIAKIIAVINELPKTTEVSELVIRPADKTV